MAKNLINKYVWLVDTIYRAGRITYEEINEKWLDQEMDMKPIPIRTFHKWKIAAEDMFNLVIECERKGVYHYYIIKTKLNAVIIAIFGYLRWRKMMKQTSCLKSAVLTILLCLFCTSVQAQDFDKWFQDKTLRLDYTFSGDNRNQYISLDEMKHSAGWFGRRVNLDSLLLLGNGQLALK